MPGVLTPEENARLGRILEVMERYQNLDMAKSLPMIALRFFVLRYGLEGTIDAVRRYGEDRVTGAAQAMLSEAGEFMLGMIGRFPPTEEAEELLAEVKALMDGGRDTGVKARIYTRVSRLRLREDARTEGTRTVQ